MGIKALYYLKHIHVLRSRCGFMILLVFLYALQILDDQELWNGSLLGSLIFEDSREVFSLSQALR